MRNPIGLAAVTALTLVLADACDSWTPAQEKGGKKVAPTCAIRLAAPVTEVAFGNVIVRGKTHAVCDRPPIRHSAQVFLQRKVNGAWVQQSNGRGESYAKCDELPPAVKGIDCSFNLYNACVNGWWRTKALVTGTNGLGDDFTYEPPEAPTAYVFCPKVKK